MSHAVIMSLFFLAIFAGPRAGAMQPQWGMGLGMESRMEKEVNPEYANLKSTGKLFTRARVAPWEALLELGREEHRTGSGSLNVATQVTGLGLWGRYEFLPRTWTPFCSLGLGSYFDRVETHFENASDLRYGRRLWAGTGLGVGGVFWQMLLLETELRVSAVQEQKDPMFSGLLRVGIQI